jgi:hypothetical protein
MTSISSGFVALFAAASLGAAAAAQAPSVDLNASESFSGGLVGFSLGDTYSHYTLTISGPGGYQAQVFSEAGAPTVRLSDFGDVADGRYTYTLTAATFEYDHTAPRLNNGREDAQLPRIGAERSGSFMISGGVVAPQMDFAEEG